MKFLTSIYKSEYVQSSTVLGGRWDVLRLDQFWSEISLNICTSNFSIQPLEFDEGTSLNPRWTSLGVLSWQSEIVQGFIAFKRPFPEIRDHVLQSLYSSDLALYALGRTHKESIELLADLQDWQRLPDLRNTWFAVANPQSAGRHKLKVDRAQTDEVKKTNDTKRVGNVMIVLQPKTSSEPSGQPASNPVRIGIKCYNCNGIGHISHDCMKPRSPLKCSNCNMKGHTRGKCPQNETALVQGYLISKQREVLPHNTYVKSAYINDKRFQAMIDTWCSVSLIRSSAAVRSGA